MSKERTPYNQIRRTVEVLKILIAARGPLKIEDILARLPGDIVKQGGKSKPGLSKRNIMRDIEFLRDSDIGLGYPIETRRGEGYFLPTDSLLLPLLFTKGEVQALCLGQDLFQPFSGTHFGDAIESVYDKVSRIYKKGKFARGEPLRRLEDAILFKSGPVRRYEARSSAIQSIFEAILDKKEIRILYTFSDNPAGAELAVCPHKLIVFRESFYLLGIPVGKKEFRLYLIDRVKDATTTENSFTPSDTKVFEERLDSAFGAFTFGKKATARILFEKELGQYLQERVWHATQRFEETSKGLWMEMDVLINEELAGWVRGFGDSVLKVEPAALAKLANRKAK